MLLEAPPPSKICEHLEPRIGCLPVRPLDVLFERADLPRTGLPSHLLALYGGDFGVAREGLYANFVASVDGVVALAQKGESGGTVSGGSEADRFVMALLRACADAVVIGAGTFRHAPGDVWDAAHAYPAAAAAFGELRAALGLSPRPQLVVLTDSGDLDVSQPALAGAIVATTDQGAARLRSSVSAATRVASLGAGRIGASHLVGFLRAEGLRSVLTEGGPSTLGDLLAGDVVDELFVTVSPRLFGRLDSDGRKGLVQGVDLAGRGLDLRSVRRHGGHLFLRYGLSRGRSPTAAT
jgi:riboflavin biosynthesis pyrimidine reductase